MQDVDLNTARLVRVERVVADGQDGRVDGDTFPFPFNLVIGVFRGRSGCGECKLAIVGGLSGRGGEVEADEAVVDAGSEGGVG